MYIFLNSSPALQSPTHSLLLTCTFAWSTLGKLGVFPYSYWSSGLGYVKLVSKQGEKILDLELSSFNVLSGFYQHPCRRAL